MISDLRTIRLWPLLLLLATFAMSAAAGELRLDFEHAGSQRSYLLYLPDKLDPAARLPMLLVLHGRAGDADGMARLTDFGARAERHGFIVAYPDAAQNHWNYLHGIPGAEDGPDDVDFLIALTAAIAEAYPIDPERIYVAGLSNGGYMAQRLACEARGPFAAFASVGAGGFGVMPQIGRPGQPVDALFIHGTADRMVPWEGVAVRDTQGNQQTVALPLSASLKFWARGNGCDPNIGVRELPQAGLSPGTRVKVYETRECADGARVALYAVLGGGHNWPGVEGVIPPSVAGSVNLDFHASDAIWSFFGDTP